MLEGFNQIKLSWLLRRVYTNPDGFKSQFYWKMDSFVDESPYLVTHSTIWNILPQIEILKVSGIDTLLTQNEGC